MFAKFFAFIAGILGMTSVAVTPAILKLPAAAPNMATSTIERPVSSTTKIAEPANAPKASTAQNSKKNNRVRTRKTAPSKKIAEPLPSTNLSVASSSATITDVGGATVYAASSTSPVDFEAINHTARNALINIFCTSKTAGSFNALSGSGVIIDPRGIILTTAHVAQYLLLKDYGGPNSLTCTGRIGSPAYPTYNLKLLYISERWVKNNYKNIKNSNPTGTGEDDFALIKISDSVDKNNPLPAAFPYLPIDENEEAIAENAPVVAIAYPAGFLGGIAIQKDLYIASTVVRIGKLYTFGPGTLDVFSLGGNMIAQHGSSGGPVVSSEGKIIGIIVTSTDAADTTGRDLDAISIAHISRQLTQEAQLPLSALLRSDLATFSNNFDSQIRPGIQKLLFDALGG